MICFGVSSPRRFADVIGFFLLLIRGQGMTFCFLSGMNEKKPPRPPDSSTRPRIWATSYRALAASSSGSSNSKANRGSSSSVPARSRAVSTAMGAN